ncbi:DUF6660 family protein [Botryobacter ruber]|uniref:DUF6660 family protein n=1 Tax=Botryobacter ruber TaxID=2171629 RepID=UPI000E0BBD54|nr:DUF6660 family protein [Botryobacter ruber]
MKYLTLLLALLVITLSVMPCCVAEECSEEEVTTEHADNHDSDADLCSPFYSCAACIGFTVSSFSIAIAAPPADVSIYFVRYRQRLFSQFHQVIWQPPKIC